MIEKTVNLDLPGFGILKIEGALDVDLPHIEGLQTVVRKASYLGNGKEVAEIIYDIEGNWESMTEALERDREVERLIKFYDTYPIQSLNFFVK